jgi:hypothetical protein
MGQKKKNIMVLNCFINVWNVYRHI